MDRNIPFIMASEQLLYVLDSDLWKMLSILIQQESYWTHTKKIEEDGSFYKPMSEFADIFRKKNLQDVRLMLQTLQSKNIIDIIPSKSKKQANYYRICWDRIAEYNGIPKQELLNSPMIESAKRTNKKKVEGSTKSYQSDVDFDSTELYYQSVEDSTELYQQDSELIVQDCTPTIDNIIKINNNITIGNSEITKSPLYEQYNKRIKEQITDYNNEVDYINALDKYSKIESLLEVATKHIPTAELEVYKSQLSEASLAHERRGWNVLLDNITDDMIQNYHISKVHNVKTPSDPQQFKIILNDLIGRTDLYISSEHWEELTPSIEKWIIHQWERDIISYDLQQEYIDKIYSKLAS